MNLDDQAREVQERMCRLRREIAVDVEHVTQSARAMTDWTFYVRRFPWATAALAAAAGFVIVPSKKTVVRPSPEQLEELARNKEFVARAAGQVKPAPSLIKGLVASLAAMAGRAAFAYISEQLRTGSAGVQRENSEPAAAYRDSD